MQPLLVPSRQTALSSALRSTLRSAVCVTALLACLLDATWPQPVLAQSLPSTRSSSHDSGHSSAGLSTPLASPSCNQTLYFTFDTGNMSHAQHIAATLNKHQVKATFFVANEKTKQGGFSLDTAWAAFYKQLLAQGHAFGSHTFDHVYLQASNASKHSFKVKPQFGSFAGQTAEWSAAQYCEAIKRSSERFFELTGQYVSPIWRSPGGRASASLMTAAQSCGYQHVGWQTEHGSLGGAGFSGDELPSPSYPNAMLLKKALVDLRDGDIFMAHLGIWSRQVAWAPAVLEPLIVGLKAKGSCFATVLQHPEYGNGKAIQTVIKF